MGDVFCGQGVVLLQGALALYILLLMADDSRHLEKVGCIAACWVVLLMSSAITLDQPPLGVLGVLGEGRGCLQLQCAGMLHLPVMVMLTLLVPQSCALDCAPCVLPSTHLLESFPTGS